MKLKFLNNSVEPPILTLSVLTTSNRRFSVNLYLDPDDIDSAFHPSQLTPEERGHTYKYFQDDQGDVLVSMPYRVMDAELYDLVKGLRSFRSYGKCIPMHKNLERSAKNPKSCIQNFKLSLTDFRRFERKGAAEGWKFVNDTVEVEDIASLTNSITETHTSLMAEIADIRKCAAKITSEEDLDTLLGRLSASEESIQQIRETRPRLLNLVTKLGKEKGRSADLAKLETRVTQCVELIQELTTLDMARFYKECAQGYTVSGKPGRESTYLGPLSEELSLLETAYPALKHLNTYIEKDGSTSVYVELSGVRVILSESFTKIVGDLAALKPYVSGVDIENKASEKGGRFKSIFLPGENE